MKIEAKGTFSGQTERLRASHKNNGRYFRVLMVKRKHSGKIDFFRKNLRITFDVVSDLSRMMIFSTV